MPDNSDPEQSSTVGSRQAKTVFDKDIGDDWGEAFEAEEFMLTPDEGHSSEFFLDDDGASPSPVSDSTIDSSKAPASASVKLLPLTWLWICWGFFRGGGRRFMALPLLLRFFVPVLVVSCAVVPFFFQGGTSLPLPHPEITAVPLTEVGEVPGSGISGEAAQDTVQDADPPPVQVAAAAPPEKVRKTWRLPPFLIQTSDNTKGDNIFFIEVDISIVLLLAEAEPLPTATGVFLRDLIYQFYNNHPIYELRRYSLARGEMNRKLRIWIEKQWPQGPIDTIIFNRYLVL